MEKGVVIFLFASVFVMSLVQAVSVHDLQIDGKNYSVELISNTDDSVIIKINNDTKEISGEQTFPYTFPSGAGYKEIDGLHVILANADENTALSSMNVSVFVGYEKGFLINATHSGDSSILIINGTNYTIQFVGATTDSATISINGDTEQISTEQTSPYQFPVGSGYKEVGGLHVILKKATISEALGYENASLYFFSGINFFLIEECVETWSCTNWSDCLSNQQTRTCSDARGCGTNVSKPSEVKSCSSNNPSNQTVECYSDEDCMLEATGSPYCDGSDLCIPSLSYECVDDGKINSYCNSTSIKDCTACENGCANNSCINEPLRECESVGLRQNEKYCSSQYTFVDQKAEGLFCDDNSECLSDFCSEGLCVKEKPSYKIYWIIGAVLLVIIIISIMFKSKKHDNFNYS